MASDVWEQSLGQGRYISAEKNGRKMALAGVNERIGALLELTHVKELLRVYATVEDAVAAL